MSLCKGAPAECNNIKEMVRDSLSLINSSQELYQEINGLSARKQMGNVLRCAPESSLKLMYCKNYRVSNKMTLVIEDKQ